MPTIIEKFKSYFESDAHKDDIALQRAPSNIWEQKGREQSLHSFRIASTRVPAYRDFLIKNKIQPEKISTFEDFQHLPTTDKETYLSQYPLDQLCVDGQLPITNLISSSSGSTGKPLYWPRYLEQDIGAAKAIELQLLTNYDIDKIPTLMVVSFGLGIWSAGIYMLTASRFVAEKDHRLTLVSPGIDLEETTRVIRNLSSYFQQTILVGFPGFAKDVIDNLEKEKFDFKKANLKVFTAGEVLTESWRNHIFQIIGEDNAFKDITSVLASAEGGLIGMETPLCVFIRRKCFQDKNIHEAFFGGSNLPSVVQYNPLAKFVEIVSKKLTLTSGGALPLIRYDTKDRSQTASIDDVFAKFNKLGISKDQILKETQSSPWSLPFVYVYGRDDLACTIYAVNVYPESVKDILISTELRGKITGRFSMRTGEDSMSNQYLEMFVELSKDSNEKVFFASWLEQYIAAHLQQVNSEFRRLSQSISRPLIQVHLRPYHDQQFFASQKQKYIIKNPNHV